MVYITGWKSVELDKVDAEILLEMGDGEFCKIRNIGKKSAQAIANRLNELGVKRKYYDRTFNNKPSINWVKLNPKLHNFFEDGSKFLVAVQVHNGRTGETKWEFDVVIMVCDGDGAFLTYEGGEMYDRWSWQDIEYFHLIEGEMPSAAVDDDENQIELMNGNDFDD
jgi:hypothetical protein